MKKTSLLRLLLVAFVSVSAFAQAPVQHSQSIKGTSGAAVTMTLPALPTAGNYVAAWIGYQDSHQTIPPAGFRLVTSCINLQNVAEDVWLHKVVAGESATYTFTPGSSGSYISGMVYELSGVNTVNGSYCAVQASSATTTFTPPLTPTMLNTLPVGSTVPNDGYGISATSTAGCTYFKSGTEYQPVNTATCALTTDTTTPIKVAFGPSGNGGGAVSTLVLFAPNGVQPVISVVPPPNTTVAATYSVIATITGGTPPYTCSPATGVPPGLALASNCALSGTPSTAGNYTIATTITDSSTTPQASSAQNVPMTVLPEPPLTWVNNYSGQAGKYLDDSWRVSGGVPPYTSTITAGAPPAGLTIEGAGKQGFLGTPLNSGTTTASVTTVDSGTPQLTLSGTFTWAMATAAAPPALTAGSVMTVGPNGSLGGFQFNPQDAWHADVRNAAIDVNSNLILRAGSTNDLVGAHLHADFGSTASTYGIPYNVVRSSVTPLVRPTIVYTQGQALSASEDDQLPMPLPSPVSSMVYENKPGSIACEYENDVNHPANYIGDKHTLIVDATSLVLYELFVTSLCNSTAITTSTEFPPHTAAASGNLNLEGSGVNAYNGATFDMTQTTNHPLGFTSADVSGQAVLSGLIRYDEIQAGAILHAIRFTSKYTKGNGNGGYFVAPATHASGNNGGNEMVTGLRIRLQAGFDISAFSATNQIILTALKTYGAILADNGSNGFLTGTNDPNWVDGELNALSTVPLSAFDVLPIGTVYNASTNPTGIVYDANTYPAGALPTITSFTASPMTVAAGSPVTLTVAGTGTGAGTGGYSMTDRGGFMRNGTNVVTPMVTTTYIASSQNAYGRVFSTPLTVNVSSAPPAPMSCTLICGDFNFKGNIQIK